MVASKAMGTAHARVPGWNTPPAEGIVQAWANGQAVHLPWRATAN
jgi:hypothetical protein